MNDTQLGIFARFPAVGKVKTRLAADVGDEAACRVYRAFVETLLARFSVVADRRVVAYTPADSGDDFRRWLAAHALIDDDAWALVPQSEGDLGARMQSYFETAFAGGSRRVVLIGSDSPTLPTEYVQQAFDQLRHNPIVLGPSDDGGYYLVGLRDMVPPMFEGIAWSQATVWRETTARLSRHGLAFHALPPWYDVDELADLHRLDEELAGPASRAGDASLDRLRRVVREVVSTKP